MLLMFGIRGISHGIVVLAVLLAALLVVAVVVAVVTKGYRHYH